MCVCAHGLCLVSLQVLVYTLKWTGAPPVAMIINSCKLRAVFGVDKFKKVTPPPLDISVMGRTRGRSSARVREVQGITQDLDQIRYVFHPEVDEAARDACVAAGAATPM